MHDEARPTAAVVRPTAQRDASARGLAAARIGGFASGKLPALLTEAVKHDAIDLALGTPGTSTPQGFVDAACTALSAGRTNQYEVPAGNLELRRQLARALSARTDPLTELTITVGATEALAAALLALVDPGDEVILFEPFYETFISAVALAGGVPRRVSLRPPTWRWARSELASAFGPRTRAILLNTPSNPTGRVLDEGELAEIAELCAHWDTTVICDEVYSAFVFDGHTHVSAAEQPALRQRSVVVGSLSKSHAMSGWRIGYIRASAELTTVLRQVHVALVAGTAAPLQEAAAQAAALDPDFGRPGDDLSAQRERTMKVFSDLGVDCMPPEGGCYVMADIRPMTDEDGESFAYRLVKEARVLVVPGSYFYADEACGNEFVRIAFNRPVELFDEVERRLAPFRAMTGSAGR